MINYIHQILMVILFLLIAASVQAQTIPFNSNRWEIDAKESRFEEYLGGQCLFLKGGLALVKDSKFLNGVIEFDIAFSPERTFAEPSGACKTSRTMKNFISVRTNPAIRMQINTRRFLMIMLGGSFITAKTSPRLCVIVSTNGCA
jgi:hypothetical protein